MPRIRTIKPEFWQDFRLTQQLTRDQRLFYIALWNESDDEGRFQAHPQRLKGAIFPYDDDIHGGFIEDSLRTLAECGKVVLYDVSGEPYAQLVHFADHQKINRPTPSRIPPPPNDLPDFTDDSLSDHGRDTESSPPERKGKERKVESFEGEFLEFWMMYPKKVGKQDSLKAWQARRREGVTAEQLMAGLIRYLAYKEATGEKQKNPATFLGPGRHWDESWEIPAECQPTKRPPQREDLAGQW